MKMIIGITIAFILAVGMVDVGTWAYFSDTESSSGNTFQAWASTQWVQTTQAHFEAGVLDNVDTSSSPGDVKLAKEGTVDVQVGASSDDCAYEDSSISLTASTPMVGKYQGVSKHSAFRFTAVDIPQGATIKTAYMRVYWGFRAGGAAYWKFYGVAHDNIGTWSPSNKPQDQTKTEAAADWDNPSYTWKTWSTDDIEIKTIIQEIVNRPGWASGQALAILLEDDGCADGTWKGVYHWDKDDHSKGAKLHIEYYQLTVQAESISGYMKKWGNPYPPTNLNKNLGNYEIRVGQKLSGGGTTAVQKPNGAGTYQEFDGQYPDSGAHYDKVDDGFTHDGDSTYIYSTTTGDKELFNVVDPVTKDYDYIEVKVVAKQVGTGTNIIKPMLRTHDTDYYGSSSTITDSYQGYTHTWSNNPFTNQPWTMEELNAAQVGVYVEQLATDCQVRVTNITMNVRWRDYEQHRGVISFDTSPIPDDATIISAELSVAMKYDYSDPDFDVHLYSGVDQWTGTSDLAWDDCSTDEGVFFNTAGKSVNTYYSHSVATSSISLTGKTQFRLISSREGTKPSGAEYIDIYRYSDASYAPKLHIEYTVYVSSGTIASQVLDTGVPGARWDALFWDETLQSNTDITFEVRASDTSFAKGDASPSWTSVTLGLPSGRYMQWRATLTTSDTSKTPTLHEVRVYHY